MSHGYTLHGHRCCDRVKVMGTPAPPLVARARCSGTMGCRQCQSDAREFHSKDLWALPPTRPAPIPRCSACGIVDGEHHVNCPAAAPLEQLGIDTPVPAKTLIAVHKLLHPEEKK